MNEYVQATIDTSAEDEVRNLPDGGAGFITPWSFIATEDGRLYVRGDARWSPRAAGNHGHLIEREGHRLVIESLPSPVHVNTAESITHAINRWHAEPVYIQAEATP